MSYHDRNLVNAPADKQTLKDRAKDWIRRNVPVHSQAEYEQLLMCNEALMLKLIAKCLDFEALYDEYTKLQYEIARSVPQVPWMVHSEANYYPAERIRSYSMRWSIDPYRINFNVSDADFLSRRVALEEVHHAMRRYFMEKAAPEMFDRGMNALVGQLARAAA